MPDAEHASQLPQHVLQVLENIVDAEHGWQVLQGPDGALDVGGSTLVSVRERVTRRGERDGEQEGEVEVEE